VRLLVAELVFEAAVVVANVVVVFIPWVMFHGLALRVEVVVRVLLWQGCTVLFVWLACLLACWGW
jgi:hypothetical protein